MPPAAAFGIPTDDVDRATHLTKECVLAMVSELVEILGCVNWKAWKRQRLDLPNVPALREELVDVFHFLVNLFLLWGMTPDDVLTLFEEKHNVNVARQKEGY